MHANNMQEKIKKKKHQKSRKFFDIKNILW